MKTALITGASGQDAYYLSVFLLEKGYKVWATQRRSGRPDAESVLELIKYKNYGIVEADITDLSSMIRAIQETKPDEFYNFGSQPEVGTSWGQPLTTFDITGRGAVNCLEAIRIAKSDTRYYFAGSSEQFGGCSFDRTDYLDENSPMNPKSPYAVAKLAGYEMTRVYRNSYDMHASCGILFNHESPHRKPYFVTRKIVLHYIDILQGRREFLELGNIDAERDWGHASDYVRAAWLMLQQDTPGDYVVGMGERHTVREFCEIVGDKLGIKDPISKIKVNPKFLRPNEVRTMVARADKARDILGWKPEFTFEGLVQDMVEMDLQRQGL